MKQKRVRLLIQLLVSLVVVIGVNVLSSMFYHRFDLTTEKRYTLSDASKSLLGELDDIVYINVYLDGEIPSEYRILKNEINDMLEEFRYASNGKIEFEFEDVLTDRSLEEKEQFLKSAAEKGLTITRPEVRPDESPTEKYIIPSGIGVFNGREYTMNFLKREFGKSLEEEINGSIELIEYEIGNLVRKCIAGEKKQIAFLQGHGELNEMEVADIAQTLQEYYTVEPLNLNVNDTNCVKPFLQYLRRDPENADKILVNQLLKKIKSYEGVVIAKPVYRFKEIEKFILDQYIMSGGKVIWLMESLIAEMDSVAKYNSIFTADYQQNLDDILFKCGARINPTLIQDIQCHGIPVIQRGGSNKPTFWPWVYYPLLNPSSKHPISRNLESVWGRFVSTIDTTTNKDIKKTVLLTSSDNSRVAHNPVNISMSMLEIRPNPKMFTKKALPTAVLLEGRFKSSFEYREGFKRQVDIPFISEVKDNAMIVISDGDLIRNQVSQRNEIYPLGYDRFASRQFGEPITFANKLFFQNCVDFLCDNSKIIDVRSKEIVLRLLDKGKVKESKRFWQWINMGVPALVVVTFGLLNFVWRRRRWS